MSRNGNVEKLAAAQKSSPSRLVADPSWPELQEAAYQGTAGRFVRKIEDDSEADPAGILVQFLVMAGNLFGRRAHFVVEADQHFTNLFAVLVGETALGRKGVALGQAKRLFPEVAPEWSRIAFGSGLSSGEGLIHAVRDPKEKLETNHEGEPEVVVVDEGVADKRLMVIETEMVSVLKMLKREGNVLSSTLRLAWDCGELRVLTKNSPIQATGAHISIICHITKAELLKNFDSIHSANGFGNRFLWCCVRRTKVLPEGGKGQRTDLRAEADALKQAADFAASVQEMQRNAEASERWREVYGSLTQCGPDIFGAITSRAAPLVVRLSCIYALLDRSDTIRLEHLDAALAVWAYCDASARWIFGEAEKNPLASAIHALLTDHPTGQTRTQITKSFKNHQSKEQVGQALDQLSAQRLITREQVATNGRPCEIWRLSSGP